ncbi:MAG: hypothetical protein J4N88_05370 [Chloroflexi bacterium]|nr:hypothetical protein [Chloroflexota bacterium]
MILNAYEHAYDQGWTDGLPIIPPSQDLVERFVIASGREPQESIAVVPPRKGRATVEVIAINAVMAGCRPEYMPALIAAVEALIDPSFPLELIQVTTNPMTPLLLFNGPIRDQLDINYGAGCLGPGWRANATIGRAIRLVLLNAGGALPGIYSKSSFASPLRYTFVLGENEEENPWTPFHVDQGFGPEDSTVTVFRATNYVNISGGEGVGPEEILRHIATAMPPMYLGGEGAMLLLGVNHARSLYDFGLSKQEIQQKLWEYAVVSEECFAADFVATEQAAGRTGPGVVRRTRKPEQMYVIVAGGPGPQDVYISADQPQTRLISHLPH